MIKKYNYFSINLLLTLLWFNNNAYVKSNTSNSKTTLINNEDFYDYENYDDEDDEEIDENVTIQSVVLEPGKNKPSLKLPTYVRLAKSNPDVIFELGGKVRIDPLSYSNNTRFLNNQNGNLDSTISWGKHTFDLGIEVAYGQETYGKKALEVGIDLRNKLNWGKPDEVAQTTSTPIKYSEYVFGEHKHNIGIPILFVRGIDFTIDLDLLMGSSLCTEHFIKFGLFPFELGNGISLGSAYAITPDFLTYDPATSIQEFAPGYLFSGELIPKEFYYKFYTGILSNKSGSFSDVNERIRGQQYGKRVDMARGFGVLNFVSAIQFDYKNTFRNEKGNYTFSPYFLFAHEGEEIVEFAGDAHADLGTLGLAVKGDCENISFNFEFAQNIGTQSVLGIDRNIVTLEARNDISTLQGVPVFVNSHVIYNSSTQVGNDLNTKNAIYLGGSDPRQQAIFKSTQDSSQNGAIISDVFSIKNATDRFRDPYKNKLRGYMAVLDATYKLKTPCGRPVLWSLALGFASGDENPNKSLEQTDDYMVDGIYDGFIGLQEIYSGGAVKSVFLMSGAGKVPRILSVPGRAIDNNNKEISVGYPSIVSRFTNLAYVGTSFKWEFDSCNFHYKVNPNALWYFQPKPPHIYDAVLAQRLNKLSLSSSLGFEMNIFFEAISENIEGLKFFGTGTIFVPGACYKDIVGLPLNKAQQKYLDNVDKSGFTQEFVPTMGKNCAYYITCGLEYKF
jgi:hypothetical protein